ncbi:MAG TPA: sulfate adenylyltransferase, partial [Rhodocyclaceae bacterium]|nr:sulfate adenylyltransferase [Rhodocyclaceae bacterium]
TARTTKAKLGSIAFKVDVNSQEHIDASALAMNDIARVSWRLAQPLFTDAYTDNRVTGAFIVVDESTNNTVGAGMIL